MKLIISISSKKITKILVIIMLCLTLASVGGQLSKFCLGHGRLLGLVRLFNLDEERSIPTWYSSSLLLFSSMLLFMIASAKKEKADPFFSHWRGLSIILLLLSVEEIAGIHESMIASWQILLNAKGLLYFAWVIPGTAFVFMVGLTFLRFLKALPPKTRRQFITAGIVYIAGSLGMEMVGGRYYYLHGKNFTYAMITTVEELLEMSGIVIFINALLAYLESNSVR